MFDTTRIPTFYDAYHSLILFTSNSVILWFRRLGILYLIHHEGYYGEVIDSILGILQFVPTKALISLLHATNESCDIDKLILNDFVRTRMCMLEESASDVD